MSDKTKFVDKYITDSGHLIHKIRAKDETGRWAYYFVLILPQNDARFENVIGKPGMINLEDYGTIVASCYGREPSEVIRKLLKDKYGFDV